MQSNAHIFVTNHNAFDHEDAYGGELYVFPKGERVLVPVEAAMHMLGFNNPDKSETLTRLGWAFKMVDNKDPRMRRVEDTSDDGVKKLAKFEFTKVSMLPEAKQLAEADPPVM